MKKWDVYLMKTVDYKDEGIRSCGNFEKHNICYLDIGFWKNVFHDFSHKIRSS